MPSPRYRDWIAQARADLAWGRASLESGFNPQACFVAQQTAEKALKALCYFRDFDIVKTHSVRRITEALGIDGEILEAARLLDQYYIPTRYPDSLPEGTPQEYFTKQQARLALEYAEKIIAKVEEEISGG